MLLCRSVDPTNQGPSGGPRQGAEQGGGEEETDQAARHAPRLSAPGRTASDRDGRQPGAPALFVGVDVASMAKRESDVVEPLEQAMLGKGIERKRRLDPGGG